MYVLIENLQLFKHRFVWLLSFNENLCHDKGFIIQLISPHLPGGTHLIEHYFLVVSIF